MAMHPEIGKWTVAVAAKTEPEAQQQVAWLKARLVELRYFAGLTGEQSAKILGISPSSADRHWVFARAWLRREVLGGARDEPANRPG